MSEPLEMNNLEMSEKAKPLLAAVIKHIRENVDPISEEYHRLGEGRADRWSYAPGQLELLETAKQKARDAGLWNFFLPNAETGEGLANLDYAYIAAELGKNPLASETLNCSAPDTGNMEVLERIGTQAQKDEWLKPLLAGEIRSAFAMTEPDRASSDAKNVAMSAVLENGEWVLNGEKYYISGAGDPRCKIMIVMVKTSPDAESIQAAIANSGADGPRPALRFLGRCMCLAMTMHRTATCTSVSRTCACRRRTCCWGEGRGFEISQVRLGPGRIHHCMRSIGQCRKGAGSDDRSWAEPCRIWQKDR